MKNIKNILVLNFCLLGIGLIFLMSCEGPMGPPGLDGIDGQDGQDGIYIVGEVFEVQVNFNAQNNFSIFDEYGFDILPSDKILMYRLDGVDDVRDIWRILPQMVFHPNGIFNYTFDFTLRDYSVFLEGNFDLNILGPEWTNDQVFRVLIVPADFINARRANAFKKANVKPSRISNRLANAEG
jgi:hypothetical protein